MKSTYFDFAVCLIYKNQKRICSIKVKKIQANKLKQTIYYLLIAKRTRIRNFETVYERKIEIPLSMIGDLPVTRMHLGRPASLR